MYHQWGSASIPQVSVVRGGGVSEGVEPAMRRIRSIAAQTPAIVISTLAVVLCLGGGAYASTHHLVAGPSQDLSTLCSPPTTGSSRQRAGQSRCGGVVEFPVLQMPGHRPTPPSLAATQGGAAEQRRLPVRVAAPVHAGPSGLRLPPLTFRPAHNMWITVYTYGGTSGTLYIARTGPWRPSPRAPVAQATQPRASPHPPRFLPMNSSHLPRVARRPAGAGPTGLGRLGWRLGRRPHHCRRERLGRRLLGDVEVTETPGQRGDHPAPSSWCAW